MRVNLKLCLTIGLASCSFLGLSGGASAQIKQHFQLLDESGDGLLSGKEIALVVALDRTRSGQVTLDNFTDAINSRESAHRIAWKAVLIERDQNEDRRLSGNELSGFEHMDLDQNRRLDEKEYLIALRESFSKLGTLSPTAVAEEAKRRFTMMDINEDGRLSGNEAVFLDASDLSADQRVTQQEYVTSLVLDVFAASVEPNEGDAPLPSNSLVEIVQAVNSQSPEAVMALCRPEFQNIIHKSVLAYLLSQIKEGNGKLTVPQDVDVAEGDQAGTKVLTAEVQGEQGTLALSAVMLGDKILGLAMNGPSVNNAIPKLMTELMADVDGKLTSFAKECSPDCMRMIRRIQAGEDDVAISMFHPQIAKQVPRETFVNLFEELRGKVGKYKKIELEAAGVEMAPSGNDGFITITHHVEGTAGSFLVQHKLQIVGFKAHMVMIALLPTEDR